MYTHTYIYLCINQYIYIYIYIYGASAVLPKESFGRMETIYVSLCALCFLHGTCLRNY